VDSLENRLEVTIPILNSNVEERLVQEEVRATPPEQIRNNLDNDLLEAEALSGWTKVEPRNKHKSKFK
jgi:hypothetical protein